MRAPARTLARLARTRAAPCAHRPPLQEDKLAGVPLLVLANKQDLLAALAPHDMAEALQLPSIRDRAWQVQGCSARDGFGVADGMAWLVKQVRR